MYKRQALVCRETPHQKVNTFSVGYQEAQYSELPYAAQVAAKLGTQHHEVIVGREEFLSVLPRLIWHEDEPITWPSSVSLFFVSRLASQHVKVVLTGEGSDEIFGGYERYHWNSWNTRAAAAYSFLPGGLRRGIRDWVAANAPKGIETKVNVLGASPGILVNPDHPAIAIAAEVFEESLGRKTVFTRSGGSIPIVGDFARHLGIPTILMGFGLPDDGLHSPNEKFKLANYYQGIATVAYFLERYGG